ncbi:MAG: hypothetical protein ACREU6_06345, partial [Steroidobacteraceae bacterium]
MAASTVPGADTRPAIAQRNPCFAQALGGHPWPTARRPRRAHGGRSALARLTLTFTLTLTLTCRTSRASCERLARLEKPPESLLGAHVT